MLIDNISLAYPYFYNLAFYVLDNISLAYLYFYNLAFYVLDNISLAYPYFYNLAFYVLDNISLAYPYFYRAMFEILEDGWQAFSTEAEFTRLTHNSDEWRISTVNKNFEVSLNYKIA